MRIIDTVTAAEELKMTPAALLNFLHRNPEYKPALRAGFNFLWTEAEIDAVRQRRAALRKRTPKEQA